MCNRSDVMSKSINKKATKTVNSLQCMFFNRLIELYNILVYNL